MAEITKKQIDAWKKEHGSVLLLVTEDGKEAYIFDPLSKIAIAKRVYSALEKSNFDFMDAVLTNCWLAGNEEIRTDEAYVNELTQHMSDVFDSALECKVEDLKNGLFALTVGDVRVEVRTAMRADMQAAQKRNPFKEPLETNIHLLRIIATDKELVDKLQVEDERTFIALLTGIDQVKNKKQVEIKKL